jgi:DivIVA domain-containing protein
MTSSDRNSLSIRLSAEAVRETRFPVRRRGYDTEEVLLFLNQVANDMQAADAERAHLRAELHSAVTELNQLHESAQPEPAQERLEISVHAVELLSQAQQTADSCVAEAEQYARDLIDAARGQYRDILQRAQHAAANSVRELAAVQQQEHHVSVPEIEYVRMYARVAQVQLRSVLDALTHEVDKLGQLSQADDYPSAPTLGDDMWEPNNLISLNAVRVNAADVPGDAEQPYEGI